MPLNRRSPLVLLHRKRNGKKKKKKKKAPVNEREYNRAYSSYFTHFDMAASNREHRDELVLMVGCIFMLLLLLLLFL